jgi:hypothetical protein
VIDVGAEAEKGVRDECEGVAVVTASFVGRSWCRVRPRSASYDARFTLDPQQTMTSTCQRAFPFQGQSTHVILTSVYGSTPQGHHATNIREPRRYHACRARAPCAFLLVKFSLTSM